jgi:hypothetical protein
MFFLCGPHPPHFRKHAVGVVTRPPLAPHPLRLPRPAPRRLAPLVPPPHTSPPVRRGNSPRRPQRFPAALPATPRALRSRDHPNRYILHTERLPPATSSVAFLCQRARVTPKKEARTPPLRSGGVPISSTCHPPFPLSTPYTKIGTESRPNKKPRHLSRYKTPLPLQPCH